MEIDKMATTYYPAKYALLIYGGHYYFSDNSEIRLTASSNAVGEVWALDKAVTITSDSDWNSYVKGAAMASQELVKDSEGSMWLLYVLGANKYRKTFVSFPNPCFNPKGKIRNISDSELNSYTQGPSIS